MASSHELVFPASSFPTTPNLTTPNVTTPDATPADSVSGASDDPAGESPREETKKKESTPLHLAVASSCLLALVLALLLRAFVAQAYEIRGKSMEPTLHDGEKVMISKLSPSLQSVDRGDLIIFSSPVSSNKDLIKRVVAVAGDNIRLEDGEVFVNDRRLTENYANREAYPRTSSYPISSPVEPGHVIVLGDNRPNSQDSRHFGPVPLSLIKGKVFMRWWPLTTVTTFP